MNNIYKAIYVSAVFLVLLSANSNAQRYWVGGTGRWTETAHWSSTSGGAGGASLPTSTVDVFFNDASFPTANDTVTLDGGTYPSCHNMDWNGVTTNNPNLVALYNGTVGSMKIYGSLTFSNAMTVQNSPVAFSIGFWASSGNNNIATAGRAVTTMYFNGTGTFSFMDSPTFTGGNASIMAIYNTGGTVINTNNFNITVGQFLAYWNITSPTALNLGSSTLTLTSSGNPWYMWNSPSFVVNAGTSTINFTGSNSFNVDLSGRSYFTVIFSLNPVNTVSLLSNDTIVNAIFNCRATIKGNNTITNAIFNYNSNIQSNNHFTNLTFAPGGIHTLTSSTTQTIDSAFTVIGTSALPIFIQSTVNGTPATFFKPSGEVCADYLTLKDNIATGGAIFNAGANSTDIGGNTGWNFPGNCTVGVPSDNSEFSLSDVYPNPTTDGININIYSLNNNKVHARMMDCFGRMVIDEINNVSKGRSIITLQMKSLSAGMYILKVSLGNSQGEIITKVIRAEN